MAVKQPRLPLRPPSQSLLFLIFTERGEHGAEAIKSSRCDERAGSLSGLLPSSLRFALAASSLLE